ncbi:MAG: PadR family transcriptional regulator [Candidatus Micrarchaeota archaeon]|nr:PadR family transcriptional regulator [Candidatus Micrarchaeota archaeon]
MAKPAAQKYKYEHPFMTKDMARTVLKIVLLKRIERGEIYSYALIKELNASRFSMFLKKYSTDPKNDIYNTVKALEKSGYIKLDARIDGGKLKNYYKITAKGSNALKESKGLFMKSMRELVKILG